MNFFCARKLIGEETKEELKCIRSGDRPNIVQVMLDPRIGKILRMYECPGSDLGRLRPPCLLEEAAQENRGAELAPVVRVGI